MASERAAGMAKLIGCGYCATISTHRSTHVHLRTARVNRIGIRTKAPNKGRPFGLRHRDRNPLFVNIQANKSGMFHEARLLCIRPCPGEPA